MVRFLSDDDVPLNLSTKHKRPAEIWSPGAICEQEDSPKTQLPCATSSNSERIFQVNYYYDVSFIKIDEIISFLLVVGRLDR